MSFEKLSRNAATVIRRPELPWGFALLLWWAWMMEPFYGVGMTTNDQVLYSLQGVSNMAAEVVRHAEMHGRFNFLFTKFIDLWFAAQPDTFVRKSLSFAVYALTPICFGYSVFRSWQNRLAFIAIATSLMWVGFRHLPPGAYPVVHHLPFLFWPVAALWLERKRSWETGVTWWKAALFGLLCFVSFFQYESLTLMSAVILTWIVYRCDLGHPEKKALWASLIIAMAVYAVCYFTFAAMHPSSYPGTQIGALSIGEIFHVLSAYTLGGLPYILVHNEVMPVLWGGDLPERVHYLFWLNPAGPMHVSELAIVVFGVTALGFFYRRTVQPNRDREVPWYAYAALILLLVIAINGPLSVTAKYQEWVRLWLETYLTSQLALYPISIALVLLAGWITRAVVFRGLPLGFLFCLGTVAWLSLAIHDHNREVSVYQRANLARWEAVSALAYGSDQWSESTIIAPELFYGMHIGEHSWSSYWSAYLKNRFDKDLNIEAGLAEPGDARPYAIAHIHLDDLGMFKALTVQASDATFVISRKEDRPPFLVNQAGALFMLDWRSRELVTPGEFWVFRIENAGDWVGPEKVVLPGWSLPGIGVPRIGGTRPDVLP